MKDKALFIVLIILLSFFITKCSYLPSKAEIDRRNNDIGLYEEWLMGLIAINHSKTPLYNPSDKLNSLEQKFRLMLKKLHYNGSSLSFWREPYYSPEVIIYKTRAKNAFTLPGGFICITTGLISHIYRESKKLNIDGDIVMAGILSHELVHLYLEHPKKHYVIMLIKDNIYRHYKEMVEGLKIASGDFHNDYSKMIIKTILKAKSAGMKGYEANMEADADIKAVLITSLSAYPPEGLVYAVKFTKHHTGGVHGDYKERLARIYLAIKEFSNK